MTANGSSFNAVLLAAGEGSRLGRVPKSLLRLDGHSLIEHQVHALLKAGAGKLIIVTGYFYSEIEAGLEQIIGNIPISSIPAQRKTSKDKNANIQDAQPHDQSEHRTEELLSGCEIRIVRNPEPEQGQQSSVRLGLETLATSLGMSRNMSQTTPLATPLTTSLTTDSVGHGRHDQDPILIALVDQPLMNSSDYQSCLTAYHQRPSACSIVYPVVEGQRGNPVVFSQACMLSILQSGLTCRNYIDQQRAQVHRFETSNDHFVVDIDQEQDRLRFEQRTGRILSLPRTDSSED